MLLKIGWFIFEKRENRASLDAEVPDCLDKGNLPVQTIRRSFRERAMFNRRAFLAAASATLIAGPMASRSKAATGSTLRIVVVANRYHEADGLMAALANQEAKSKSLSLAREVVFPRAFPADLTLSSKPRCLIDIKNAPSDQDASATMEIWCIDDLAKINGSGSKATAMKTITDYGPAPDGVVAFGTGAYPGDVSNDGCAAVGGTMFVHDASNGTAGGWSWPSHMETLVPSSIPASFYADVIGDKNMLSAISDEMIKPKNNPASDLQLIISADAVGISSLNEHPPYCEDDTAAIAKAQQAGAKSITSVETTHGIIRSMWDAPFIYVTAIPNRLCHFADEASGIYAQEFPSSHNAGVALKHVIPYFAKAISA